MSWSKSFIPLLSGLVIIGLKKSNREPAISNSLRIAASRLSRFIKSLGTKLASILSIWPSL